jgi:hypothetical protein
MAEVIGNSWTEMNVFRLAFYQTDNYVNMRELVTREQIYCSELQLTIEVGKT